MKFSLSWLKHFLNTNASLDDIVETLVKAGIEVEGVIDNASSLKEITVAHIIKVEKHPNADKLSLCTVVLNANQSETVQVVCGAPNVRPNMKVAYARIGTCIPKTNQVLKKSAIRGIDSQGMLCSFDELKLPGDSDGIMDLPEESVIGMKLEKALIHNPNFSFLFDPIIEVSLTPNRADWFSILGIAREISNMGIGTLIEAHLPSIKAKNILLNQKMECRDLFTISNEAKEKCQFFSLVKMNNIGTNKTPEWMQARLLSYGIEPKGLLIDLSNYICIHIGQPIHIYDWDKIKTPLCIDLSNGTESFTALDQKKYQLPQNAITVYDQHHNPITLAGIMGGMCCAVDHTTKNILVELAHFDEASIALAGQNLNIHSHARTRFERGISPSTCNHSLNYAIDLITNLSSGTADSYQIYQNYEGQNKTSHPSIILNTADVIGRIGTLFTTDEIIQHLEKLNFKCIQKNEQSIEVTAPLYRLDIQIKEDLIEEILRSTGFENIPNIPLPLQSPTHEQCSHRFLRSFFTQKHFNEIITYSMLSDSKVQSLEKVEIHNPITLEMNNLRPSLFPGLLNHIKRLSQLSIPCGRYFEIGHIFNFDKNKNIVESKSIAGIVNFTESVRHWKKTEPFDFFEMKKIISELFHTLNVTDFNCSTSDLSLFHPGQSVEFYRGKHVFARFGSVHPSILQKEEMKGSAFYFEMDYDFIDTLLQKKQKFKPYIENTLQPIFRDFSFWIDDAQPVETLISTILKTNKELIKDVQIFDIYQNTNDADGKKSVALQVTIQPLLNKPLDGQFIDDLQTKIILEVEQKCKAKLRG